MILVSTAVGTDGRTHNLRVTSTGKPPSSSRVFLHIYMFLGHSQHSEFEILINAANDACSIPTTKGSTRS